MKVMQFHKLLIHVSSLYCERRRRQFYELNLSDGQPKVLANLLIMEGCIQKELAQICHVKTATMTALLQKMERDGLIIKKKEFVSGGKRANKNWLFGGRKGEIYRITFKGDKKFRRFGKIDCLLR